MPTKIQLSQKELELVQNTEWILTKHAIIKKVYEMFGGLNEAFKGEVEPYSYLFPDIKNQNGKISKGENYQQLPYVILDYPSFFDRQNIFAVRTMFWWGNFFSITLHISGTYKERFISPGSELFSFLQKNNFFISVNEDEWQHHFEEDNYKPVSAIGSHEFEALNRKDFFKISKKISISQWENANEFIINSFREIMQLLTINYQDDKKDPLPVSPKAGSGL